MNKIRTFLLMLPFLGLCVWTMYYTHFLKNATEVVLPITGYDPRNLLSGHYIEFQINWYEADCYQSNWNGHCPKAEFVGINRYYVPESQALKLERMIGNSNNLAEIVFAYQVGTKPVAKELLINGKPYNKMGRKNR